jgi:hypothetical protein
MEELMFGRVVAAVVLAGVVAGFPGAVLAGNVLLSDKGPAVEQARVVLRGQLDMLAKGPGSQAALVTAGFADVGDKDGPALVAQIEHPATCGSRGCQLVIYRHVGSSWQRALEVTASAVGVRAGSGRVPMDLVIDNATTWRWNGSAYAPDAR